MAIEAVRATEESQVKKGFWSKVGNLFSPIAEYADLFFHNWNLDVLEGEHRANLSIKEKAEIDADLHGVHRN